jgi:ribonuclease BN (tRNA processing enzyme)
LGDVSVQFIGSGDAFGSGGRFQTCFLVRAPSGQALIDCGASSVVALKRAGVDCSAIDLIAISHLHGDHFGGLPFFLLDAHFVARRERPLTIAGPPGLIDRMQTTIEAMFPGSGEGEPRFPLEYVELPEAKEANLGDWWVTPHEVIHPSGAPAYGLRVEVDGKLIAYSGDSEWTDNLFRVADGADLFICECYMFERRVRYHLTYRELAERRAEFNCRRMILTHMSADMLGRLDDVEIDTAHDGRIIEL